MQRPFADLASAPDTFAPIAPRSALDRLIVDRLAIPARIGVHDHERSEPQEVEISLDLYCNRDRSKQGIEAVVCYENLLGRIRLFATSRHIELVEDFAAGIADICLQDARVAHMGVRVVKTKAIPDARSVGVEIWRCRAV